MNVREEGLRREPHGHQRVAERHTVRTEPIDRQAPRGSGHGRNFLGARQIGECHEGAGCLSSRY